MIAQRRGKNVAVAGAVLQSALAVVMLIIWLWTGSLSALSGVLLLAGGVPLWLLSAVLFYCRQLERREAIELEELAARGGPAGTIFEDAQDLQSRPAAARLAWMRRWLVPAFTILWAGYHAAIGANLVRYLAGRETPELLHAGQGALFAVVIWFLAFLFGMYCIGMSRSSQWRLLRATGSYLLVNVLFIVAVAVSLLAAWLGQGGVDLVVAYAIAVVQLILAVELLLNFILDLYRPRIPGREVRPSFDSRLFNIVAEPGRVGHSIAEALNYQFGFDVSKTWFYQLVSKAFVPLLVLGAAVMFAMSSVVIVRDGEQYVVLHWGRCGPDRGLLGPGIHLKWPWPIDTTRRFEAAKVHEILLGVGKHRKPTIVNGTELYLWTEQHGRREELDFLIAVPPETRAATLKAGEEKAPPVSILKLVVPVHYVITDPYKYGYEFTDAAALLEGVAYSEMIRYCASATLDSRIIGGVPGRPEAIMTFGRARAAEELKNRIQKVADKLGLGVRIEYVALSAVHPPAEAAGAFEEVIKAERQQDQTRYKAETEANEALSRVAGDPALALKLALDIRSLEELGSLRGRRSAPAQLDAKLTEYLARARGDIATLGEEIRRQRLLGQDAEAKLKLLARHQEHLESLREIRRKLKAHAPVDFAGRIANARWRVDESFKEALGEPVALVEAAGAERWALELGEWARAELFRRELLAYQASPNVYKLDRLLDVYDQVLPNMKKYVLGVDRDKVEIRVNLERQTEIMGGVTFERPGPGGEK